MALTAFGGASAAQAEGLLGPEVRLAADAPTPGELISGVRSIEGTADAPEGITRVELYVVPHQLTGSVKGRTPVASTTETAAPLSRVQFSFSWDSTKTVQGVVDVIVVATTPTTRTGEARVLSLRVSNTAAAVAPKPATAPRPAAHAASARPSAASPTVVRRVAAPRAVLAGQVAAPTARTAARVPSPLIARAKADQATSFYTALGTPTAELSAPPARRVAASAVSDAGRSHAPSVAVALVLLLAAAHTQRAVRVSLAPVG